MNDSNFIINTLTLMAMILLLVMAFDIVRNIKFLQRIVTYCFNIPYLNIHAIIAPFLMLSGFPLIRDYINNKVVVFHLEPYFMPNHYYISSFLGISETDMKKFIEPTEIITAISPILTMIFVLYVVNKNIMNALMLQQKLQVFFKKHLGLNDNYSDLTSMVCVCFTVAHLVYIIAWVMIALYLKIRV